MDFNPMVTRIQSFAGGPQTADDFRDQAVPAGVELPLMDFSRTRVFSAKRMSVATEDFEFVHDGERSTFRRGNTWVSTGHPAVLAHPDRFASDGSKDALNVRGRKIPLRERAKARRASEPSAEPRITEMRSAASDGSPTPPWRIAERTTPTPQTRRPRAVVGDGIYDMSTVRGSILAPEEAARELRDRSLRAIERWSFPHGRADADAVRGHLAELIDTDDGNGTLCRRLLIAGSPRHQELFARAARGGLAMLRPEEKRAMSLDGPGGGFAVPPQLDPTIVPTSSGVINPLRAISRVETTTTDIWKGVTGEGPKARYRAEGTEAEEGKVELAQPELKMESADFWEPAAFELVQDWGGLEPQLASMLQRAKDELEAEKFLSGTGEDEPFGLLTGATETIETATKGTFAVEDLEAIEDDLPDGFLSNASFLGHRKTLKRVQGFTVDGAPIWVKIPGETPEINGLPAHELSSMAATVKGGDLILALGDFSYFLIVDRIGMSIHFAEQFGKDQRPTGQMGVLALWRNNSKVLSEKAFRVLKVKA